MIDDKCAELWCKTTIYKKRIASANKIILDGLNVCKQPFVSCSFGKDSAVMLHLVQNHVRNIEARFLRWPETNIINNYEDVIAQWDALGANIKILDMARDRLNENVADRWSSLAKISDSDGSFVGLRADESKGRRITLRANGVVYKSKSGFYRICPLAYWKSEDVAAYAYQHDLPMLNTYKDSGYQSRTSSRIPRSDFGIREEMLRDLKIKNPAGFKELEKIYSEVSEYA